MLKWITPKGTQSRTASRDGSNQISGPQLTDDPLATINIDSVVVDVNRMPHSKSGSSKHHSEPEKVYSVSRINPLFVDSRDALVAVNLSEGEKRLMDDSHSSNRSEHCRTPSSSGYESATGRPEKRPVTSNHHQLNKTSSKLQEQSVRNYRHHGHHQQHLVELSPASDYRRQFVLGRLDRSPPSRKVDKTNQDAVSAAGFPRRIGQANVIHQNSLYVSNIHMSFPSRDQSLRTRGEETVNAHIKRQPRQWHVDNSDNPSDQHKVVPPQPVWPSRKSNLEGQIDPSERSSQPTASSSSAVVKQDPKYVTKILIAPRTTLTGETSIRASIDQSDIVANGQAEAEVYDSIVTHSLLMLTSYDGKSTDSSCDTDADVSQESNDNNDRRSSTELNDIRKLSQTLSQSRMVATVSRALSKTSGSFSSEFSHSSQPGSTTHLDPSQLHSSSIIGSSIARRISLMKERWEKNSRRRLLTENEDDDPASHYRTLDHLYVPQNGDVNFSTGQLLFRVNSERTIRGESSLSPFSYLAGIQSNSSSAAEESGANDEIRMTVPNRLSVPCQQVYGDPFEQDRQSNSSSRSSGSRRVTFSADTVDNEHGSKTSSSTGSVSGGSDRNKPIHHQTIIEELKLNPQYLPHRYQHPEQLANVDRSRLAGYYSHNLQAHNELSYHEKSKRSTENVNTWEHYHNVIRPLSTSSAGSTGSPLADSTTIRIEAHGDLQLHPNYGAACQDRLPCMDFTLDGGEVSLLQRRSDNDKLRRRLCCCVLLLLCLAVLVVVVIGISLYLSHGQKIFGSVGP